MGVGESKEDKRMLDCTKIILGKYTNIKVVSFCSVSIKKEKWDKM
jgi:hypothetical protein